MNLMETAATSGISIFSPPRRPSWRVHEDFDIDFFAGMVDEEHPMWSTERIEFKSVGIDIGSSTSHLVFSRLVLRRQGTKLSSRFVVVSREIIWKSEILLTPYVSKHQIDVPALAGFIEQSYQAAGMTADSVDTGAVIITGEAARKENAEAITNLFSRQAGKFVCATAGPNLEAMMSAYGSGGVRLSREGKEEKTILVVDVGGGTSKIALVRGGVIRETAATNVGGRLVAMNGSGRLTRIEEPGERVAKELGIRLQMGECLGEPEKEKLAARLADVLLETIALGKLSPLAEALMVTQPFHYHGNIDAVVFSGGVGEYIYGTETQDYHDLGELLGREIRKRLQRQEFAIPVAVAEERIRATVIGASQYTVQVSGNTIFVSNEDILPLKNLKVVFPRLTENHSDLTASSVAVAVQQAFTRFDLVEGEQPVALAFHWPFDPSYELLRNLTRGIAAGLPKTIGQRQPIVLAFNTDIGKTVGRILREELHIASDIVAFDQVHLHDFDFIDVGEVMPKIEVVPIVIKSLVFGRAAEALLKEKHIH
jgi:ethanolamine utilization protein EutA